MALPTIFLSYSHRDELPKERLVIHLGVLRGYVKVWDDRRLKAGDNWLTDITKAIASARVAVLLISADYLNSDFTLEQEVPKLLLRRANEGMRIIPVLLRACAWQQIPWLEPMQIRPTDAQPLMGLRVPAREEAFVAIATEIRQLSKLPASAESLDPSFSEGLSMGLTEELEASFRTHEEAVTTGGDTSASLEKILELKRLLRQESQLKPGAYLAKRRYRLLEILGHGGFSTVFKAYDSRRLGLVAVKVLHAQYRQDRTRRERFFRGARKMAELQHQAIVRVINVESRDEDYCYFVMEYANGGDLRQAVKAGKIGGVEDLPVLDNVAAALEFAHCHGLVHRDVKPANILLTSEGKPKLTDFDLVRASDSTAGTRTGSMLGTFLYMAPEAMMAAEQADLAVDVYSLAMCAAFVLNKDEIPVTFMRAYDSFFDGLTAPPGVKAVLRRATSLKPEDRYPSVKEFWEAVKRSSGSKSAGEALSVNDQDGTSVIGKKQELPEVKKFEGLSDEEWLRFQDELARALDRVIPNWLRSERDDLVHSSLVRIAEIVQRKPQGRLSASYLWRVAHNAVVDEIRRRSRWQELEWAEDLTSKLNSLRRGAGPDY